MLSKRAFDLVVADEDLGDMTALEVVAKAPQDQPHDQLRLSEQPFRGRFHEASEGLGIMSKLPKQTR